MAEPEGRVLVELPARTLFKVLAIVALVLCVWKLSNVLLLLIVAVVLAVALDAPVSWLERRGLSRALASLTVTGFLAAAVAGFLWLTWSSLTTQWEYLSSHLSTITADLMTRTPTWMLPKAGAESRDWLRTLQLSALGFAQSTLVALTLIVLGFFLTIYFLIEARQTVRWAIAFFPPNRRGKVAQTLSESRAVIQAYAAGNVFTSIFAATWVLVWLIVLKVPAALLLAVITGIADFVPLLGFIASVVPASALALTVSPRTGILVIGLYVVYHVIENYLIGPWAYGRQLRLSDLAVIVAFVVGAELAGVIGAIIALPVAALYPTIERIWLREQLPADTVGKHRALTEAPGD